MKHEHGYRDTIRDEHGDKAILKIKDMLQYETIIKKKNIMSFLCKIFIESENNYIFYSNISNFSSKSITICHNIQETKQRVF